MNGVRLRLLPWFKKIHKGEYSISKFYNKDNEYRRLIDRVIENPNFLLTFEFGDPDEYTPAEIKELAIRTASLLTFDQFRNQIAVHWSDSRDFAIKFLNYGVNYYLCTNNSDDIPSYKYDPISSKYISVEKVIDVFRDMAERDAFIRDGTPKDLLYQLVGVIANELLEKERDRVDL